MNEQLRAPWPYMGGKSTIAADVWERIGAGVDNLVEPFFGSGAFLLARPGGKPRGAVETVNDANGFLANFWRGVQFAPDEVARWADWPVNERDLEARHFWLLTEGAKRIAPLAGDPMAFDAQVAGWWAWGACAWIGGGWCSGEGPWQWAGDAWKKRGNPGRGINRKLPHVVGIGKGINRQLPHVGGTGSGERSEFIRAWFARLSDRLRDVRVACGDWSRVTSTFITTSQGLTGVFLDPPYHGAGSEWQHDGYNTTEASGDVWDDVTAWCRANGDNPLLRIAICGYDGAPGVPESWKMLRWVAKNAYGSMRSEKGRDNRARETVWFSPACLEPQGRLL